MTFISPQRQYTSLSSSVGRPRPPRLLAIEVWGFFPRISKLKGTSEIKLVIS